MKKLIIAAVAICAAIVSQAAAANWKVAALNIYNGTGSAETSAKYSGTAYFFDAGVATQSSLYSLIAEAVAKGSTFDAITASGYATSATVANGGIAATTFAYGEQSVSSSDLKNYSFYFVLLDEDKVYFSNIKDVSASATTTAKTVGFGSQAAGSQLAPTTTGFAGAGAWSSVPEPTSAILLMLGLCGLALKRKNV